MLGVIRSAADSGDYKAAETFLRLSFFPQYTKAETNVNVGVQTQLVCSEQQRARLIALNEKLLSGETKKLPELTTED